MGYGILKTIICCRCKSKFESTADTDTCVPCLLKPSRSDFKSRPLHGRFHKNDFVEIEDKIETAKKEAAKTGKPVIIACQQLKSKRTMKFEQKICEKCHEAFNPTGSRQKKCKICGKKVFAIDKDESFNADISLSLR